MTRNEMLEKLGLTDRDFNNLLDQFRQFYGSLNAAQQAVVNRMMPKFKRTAAILGGNVTSDELKTFIAPPPAPPSPPVATAGPAPVGGTVFAATQNGINQITNPDPNDPS